MQRYKSDSSSVSQELIREKLVAVHAITPPQEGMSPQLEQLLRTCVPLGHTSLYPVKFHVYRPVRVTLYPRTGPLSRLHLPLVTTFLNPEQLPKHNAAQETTSLHLHRWHVSSRLLGTMS